MYVVDRDRQIMLIREMTQLRKDPKSWEVYYHHPSTNNMWKSYFPRARGEERGPKVMRVEPAPEPLDVLVHRCLDSDSVDDAIGLGLELSVNPSRWASVMEVLEQHWSKWARGQLVTFLRCLGVEQHVSLFDEIDYDPSSDGLTDEHFEELRRRARNLRWKRFLYPI
ncbi:MAG: hypothetical protein U5K31_00505 [Balneolaceae bacterium]|nr:hypothetical protein [Balneolaceae bacterium]